MRRPSYPDCAGRLFYVALRQEGSDGVLHLVREF